MIPVDSAFEFVIVGIWGRFSPLEANHRDIEGMFTAVIIFVALRFFVSSPIYPVVVVQ